MHTGSGPPQVTLRAEVDRICRIAGVAALHSYAPFCIFRQPQRSVTSASFSLTRQSLPIRY